MKPLLIMRFPGNAINGELREITEYLKTHSASDDYHFLAVRDDKWDGPIEFNYFNNTDTN